MNELPQEQIARLREAALKRCSDRIDAAERRRGIGNEKVFNPVPHCGITSFLKRYHGL